MPQQTKIFRVFISYSSKDEEIAFEICSILEKNAIKCWIAPRNVRTGYNYDEEIVEGIETTTAIIVLLSGNSNESDHVKRELELAMNEGHRIYPIRIQNIEVGKKLKYILAGKQWIDLFQLPFELKLKDLIQVINQMPDKKNTSMESIKEVVEQPIIKIEEAQQSTVQKLAEVEPNTLQIPKQKSLENPQTTVKPEQVQSVIPKDPEVKPKKGQVLFNPEFILFVTRGENFIVGTKESKIQSFYYGPGTVIEYFNKGKGDIYPWYQISGFGGTYFWFTGPGPMNSIDKRVFFKIVETEQIGYLVEILGDRTSPWGSLEEIKLEENMLGVVTIKSDQIISISTKKDEMSVKTKDSGALTGGLQKLGNYNCGSFTMGPCLVTHDAVIPLIRTNRVRTLTFKRIAESEKTLVIPELLYCDRSQLKFHIPAREAVGHFNKSVNDSHLHFIEESLGRIRIYIPQIKKLTVDLECKETPVILESFLGNIYRGVCPELFDLSGAMISLDKVKNIVLEAFDRKVHFES